MTCIYGYQDHTGQTYQCALPMNHAPQLHESDDGMQWQWDDHRSFVSVKRLPAPQPPKQGWIAAAHFPNDRYIIVEDDTGWWVFHEDDHGAFS
jgi:hypothetical protein